MSDRAYLDEAIGAELELARVIGHRNPASLMLYYNTPADDLAG